MASFSLVGLRWRSRGPRSCSRVAARRRSGTPRVRSHYRFRNRSTEYSSVSGIKWMSGSTKRHCDRALSTRTATAASCAPHRALHAPALRQHPGFPGPAHAPSTLGVDVKVIQPPPCNVKGGIRMTSPSRPSVAPRSGRGRGSDPAGTAGRPRRPARAWPPAVKAPPCIFS